jgi:nitrogen regulatory protein P-II 1
VVVSVELVVSRNRNVCIRCVLTDMKKIEAIIRPLRLDEVKIALGEIGVTGMSVSDVRGVGSSPDHFTTRRIAAGELLIRTRIEIVAMDDDVDEIISLIVSHARTNEPGDGKIFVMPMLDAIRVRTEERGDNVL